MRRLAWAVMLALMTADVLADSVEAARLEAATGKELWLHAGTARGCVFLGLLMGIVTVLLYEFSHTPLNAMAAGLATAALLCIGAFIGIRRGTWK
jgi:hypothetical protein